MTAAKPIKFSLKVERRLHSAAANYNAFAAPGRRVTKQMLKTVYRRGAAEYSSTLSTGSRDEFAMKRVKSFLALLTDGKPAVPTYTFDNDVLPQGHPRSLRGEAAMLRSDLLQVALQTQDKYGSPEHAIFAMAEYSDLSYDIIPALRGAWLRGARDGESPFQRAFDLATELYKSKDSDLLPKKRRAKADRA